MTTMIKKQDKPIGSVSFQLGTMMRTIDVYIYGWGVSLSVRDKIEKGQTIFDRRNFNETKKYPDIESNIRRGMRYYKASELLIDEVLKQYAKRLVRSISWDDKLNAIIEAARNEEFAEEVEDIDLLSYIKVNDKGEKETFEERFDYIDTTTIPVSVHFICGTGYEKYSVPIGWLTDESIDKLYECVINK